VADDGKPGSVEEQAQKAQANAGQQEEEQVVPEKTWYGFKVLDASGNPVKNEKIKVKLPDGKEKTVRTDGSGIAKVDDAERGGVWASFPDRYEHEWTVVSLEDKP
jgi:hypothetical protein